jgi:hypothetical protein
LGGQRSLCQLSSGSRRSLSETLRATTASLQELARNCHTGVVALNLSLGVGNRLHLSPGFFVIVPQYPIFKLEPGRKLSQRFIPKNQVHMIIASAFGFI